MIPEFYTMYSKTESKEKPEVVEEEEEKPEVINEREPEEKEEVVEEKESSAIWTWIKSLF